MGLATNKRRKGHRERPKESTEQDPASNNKNKKTFSAVEIKRDPIRCIYCNQLVLVHHVHCDRCGDVACTDCVGCEEYTSNFLCEECAKLEGS
jgi:hypothetical protein